MRRRSRRPHAGPAAPARSRRRRPRRRVRIARTRLRRRRPAPARRRQRRNLFKKRKHIERAMILEGRICVESGTGGGAHHYYYSVQAGSGRLVRLPAKTLRGCPSRGPDTGSRVGGGDGRGGGGGGGTRMGPAWGRSHDARWPDPSHPRSESSEIRVIRERLALQKIARRQTRGIRVGHVAAATDPSQTGPLESGSDPTRPSPKGT